MVREDQSTTIDSVDNSHDVALLGGPFIFSWNQSAGNVVENSRKR